MFFGIFTKGHNFPYFLFASLENESLPKGLEVKALLFNFTLKCFSIGTPKPINFPFVPNGKLMGFGVPIFKHIRIFLQKLSPIEKGS